MLETNKQIHKLKLKFLMRLRTKFKAFSIHARKSYFKQFWFLCTATMAHSKLWLSWSLNFFTRTNAKYCKVEVLTDRLSRIPETPVLFNQFCYNLNINFRDDGDGCTFANPMFGHWVKKILDFCTQYLGLILCIAHLALEFFHRHWIYFKNNLILQ